MTPDNSSALCHDPSHNKTQPARLMKWPVNCNLPLSGPISHCDTPFSLCLPLKQVVFLVWPAISKGGPLFSTKTRASRALLNDNTLRNQLVFTAEEVECIKPRDWLLLCLPLLIGWKAVSCWYNSEGKQWSEEETGKKGKEEWKQQIKKNAWLVGFLRADENIKIIRTCQTLTCGQTLFIHN